ncbi:hypothetical protein ACRALDRAFT_1059312 [Sodiomyces alcalophilus JCM 7366]|uniref:uncharacterized protein n=1 Tax=Sodiomyces alcalophilus JCM 7366 TaxID=591952 RepID=UPI0039B4F9C8
MATQLEQESPSKSASPTLGTSGDPDDAARRVDMLMLSDSSSDDEAVYPKGTLDPVYEAKARILNRAIQKIGMGRYQWQLFVVIGFGWAADNLWPIVTSLILTPVANEFNPTHPPLLTLAQNIGLLAGAAFWGFGCDFWGRRWAFNITLGLTATWGLIAAGANNFAAIASFAALWSFGVGGNLPVDAAIFLEALPSTHQWLLTALSVKWSLAQLLATLIAWPLLGNLTCEQDEDCTKGANMGWRYFTITMGGITMAMFLVRFLAFKIYESPKFLMSKGRDQDAVRVVHRIAERNGKVTDLTLDHLKACEPEGYVARTDAATAAKRYVEKLSFRNIRQLFASRRLGLSTSLIMSIWALIGLGYPLYNAYIPYIMATRGDVYGDGSTYITYRNSLVIAATGVPGALLGAWLVERRMVGRKGTLALSTMATGVFLYGSTTSRTSDALLGFNCAFSFCSNIMYAVLYGFTPELFPTPQRGTGNALAATSNRVFGIMAPIVAMFGDLQTAAPVYTSGALFIAAGIIALLLPYESRGKAAL